MKRHIAWLMACGVLAGCTSEPSPIDAPTLRRAIAARPGAGRSSGLGSSGANPYADQAFELGLRALLRCLL